MRPFGIVATEPVGREGPGFDQRAERMGVEDLGPIGLVEALDEGVLRRLARLDKVEPDPALVRPVAEAQGDELGTVVQTQRRRGLAEGDQLVEQRDDPAGGEREADLDRQALAIACSRTFRVRNTRPSSSVSRMKSSAHVWLSVAGASSGSST